MQQVIFQNTDFGYSMSEVLSDQSMEVELAIIAKQEAQVICIIDVETNCLTYIDEFIDIHLQLMKASYPRTIFGRILNKSSFKNKPPYSFILSLEACKFGSVANSF